MSRKKKEFNVDEFVAAWKAANQKEREEFVEGLIKLMGKEELYLVMVDAAGGEEELADLIRHHHLN